MRFEDHYPDMRGCCRCSMCKFIPFDLINGLAFSNVCPSIAKYNFHAYSAGGRLNISLGLYEGRMEYSDELLEVIFRCQMCGACDVSCKITRDMEPLETMYALRAKCVEDGQVLLEHLPVIESLRNEDNTMQGSKAERGKWAEGLDVRDITSEKAEVVYHAGCRYSFDEELWPAARGSVRLLGKAGVTVGIAGKDEVCCGGRAYEMGYEGEFAKYADHNMELFAKCGAKTLVTSCADGYQTFKVIYDKMGRKLDVEVLHITEYLDRLISEGRLSPANHLPMKVTYHDPCHLGRMAEPYVHWQGEIRMEPTEPLMYDPPKEWRRGTHGIYEPPRNILKAIPGLDLVEMQRIKEYAWCCGAGGGVKEAYEDFALWAALERVQEAQATGAEALITACPWCKRNFLDSVEPSVDALKILDVVELLEQAI